MGSGAWTECGFASYAVATGRGYDAELKSYSRDYITSLSDASQAFVAKTIDKKMSPLKVMRECVETDEHPNTIPVILALDVTGSMGQTAIEIQKKLNPVMEQLIESVKDVEIMIMAIGDLAYDKHPIQISQFESDIRIAENLDKIYFEFGGGCNPYESYTAAWYMGCKHTKLDCLKRGQKGLIITMGDEIINPYLPADTLSEVTGDTVQSDVQTPELFKEVSEMYNVYHICVKSGSNQNQETQKESWKKIIGSQNVMVCTPSEIDTNIIQIVKDFAHQVNSNGGNTLVCEESNTNVKTDENGEIYW